LSFSESDLQKLHCEYGNLHSSVVVSVYRGYFVMVLSSITSVVNCLWTTADVHVCIIHSDSSVKSCKFRVNLHDVLLTQPVPAQGGMRPPEGQEFFLNFLTTFFSSLPSI